MIGAALIVLAVACIVLVLASVQLVQVIGLRRQMDAFATQWRQEMVGLVRFATEVAERAGNEVARVEDLVEESEADLRAREVMTHSVLQAVAFPFVSVGRVRLGYQRAKAVFVARREGQV
ncbi:MAG: hypothetical protein ACYDHP_03085 [Ferrimicrobium sp.]